MADIKPIKSRDKADKERRRLLWLMRNRPKMRLQAAIMRLARDRDALPR